MKTQILLIATVALALAAGDAMARGGGGGGGGMGGSMGGMGGMSMQVQPRTMTSRPSTLPAPGTQDRTQDRIHQDQSTATQDRTQDRIHQDQSTATQDRQGDHTQDRLRLDQDAAVPDGQAARQGNGYVSPDDPT